MKNLTSCNDFLDTQIRCVSHEIRNHLSICDMYSQIIKRNLQKEGINNDSIDNAIICIQKSIQIISSNVRDLKSINVNTSRIYDFKEIVEKGVELSKAYIEDKDIGFEVFIKNSANIYADENRLISCIVNIIKNGIESINTKGKITVLGEIKENKAILKISNNGTPISKDKQEKIFTQGYTSKKDGCGIGLYVCKNYLESQNATIKLNKSTKTETQFEIVMPIYKN